MRVLLLTPPMTQVNTPYPATAYLTGYLRRVGYEVAQADPALELVLRLFSRAGLTRLISQMSRGPFRKRSAVAAFLERQDEYLSTVDPAIRFLQGKDPALALRIVSRSFLPEGPRFAQAFESYPEADGDPLDWAFGALGVQDRAKYLASLFLDDLSDVVREGVDPRFSFSRYAEKLAASQSSFEPLRTALLNEERTGVDQVLEEIAQELAQKHRPDVLGLSVPFPGNVYGAFRMAQVFRRENSKTRIVMGGGYVNTELRELADARVFDFVDYITLDDGETPMVRLLEHLEGKREGDTLCRTLLREGGKVVLKTDPGATDVPHRDVGAPAYDGLPLDRYLSVLELLNPMHRIWSDGRWNKLTVAHGCYWKKCAFCDISLDYIGRYDPAAADEIVSRMEQVAQQTGQTGFHFVDEALPPAGLRALAEKLIERGLSFTWWGNIRFEKSYTAELAELLARSGCVALSGGLEVASDRLLKLMNKGVSVEQVASVTHHLTRAGIMVHAYLMYGFPTQTEQETIDSLERVRQLFENGCIQSAYWHRFSVTAHSPIGKNPEKYGIELLPEKLEGPRFARNDLEFHDPTPCNHSQLGEGLRKAVYNFMHGIGLDEDVRSWFGPSGSKARPPVTTVRPDLISSAISKAASAGLQSRRSKQPAS